MKNGPDANSLQKIISEGKLASAMVQDAMRGNPGIPLIGAGVDAKRCWKCAYGHTYQTGPNPIVFAFGPAKSGPICPRCCVDWFGEEFKAEEVTQEEFDELMAPKVEP